MAVEPRGGSAGMDPRQIPAGGSSILEIYSSVTGLAAGVQNGSRPMADLMPPTMCAWNSAAPGSLSRVLERAATVPEGGDPGAATVVVLAPADRMEVTVTGVFARLSRAFRQRALVHDGEEVHVASGTG